MRINPYLVTNGNGREAVAFYEQALGAEVLGVMTFGEAQGDSVPAEAKDRVMHALLKVGESELMLSDTWPGQEHQVGNHVTIALHVPDVATAKRMFDALAVGGNVTMPLQETFWSPAYGQLIDKFGVAWQVSTAQAEDS